MILGSRSMTRFTQKRRQDSRTAKWYAVTTSAHNYSINLTITAPIDITWGDGTSTTVTTSGTIWHNYTGAGTWPITILNPDNVIGFNSSNSNTLVNSLDIVNLGNIQTFYLAFGTRGGTFDSLHLADWRPASFDVSSMNPFSFAFNSAHIAAWNPASFTLWGLSSNRITGTFKSADIAHWRPATFQLSDLRAGLTGLIKSEEIAAWSPGNFTAYNIEISTTINFQHLAAWRPNTINIGNSSTSIYKVSATLDTQYVAQWDPVSFRVSTRLFSSFVPGGIANWRSANSISFGDCLMNQTQVNAVLWDIYQMSQSRTALNGTIGLNGNTTPSGTHRAATSCPVTAATPGKEIAHELKYDTCGAGFNKWNTVSIAY